MLAFWLAIAAGNFTADNITAVHITVGHERGLILNVSAIPKLAPVRPGSED